MSDEQPIYTHKVSPYSSHEQILSCLTRPGRVLDLGSSSGLLTLRLKNKGLSSVGVDMIAPQLASPLFDQYIQMNLEEPTGLSFPFQFEYVLMADVIEHLRTATPLLQVTKSLLKQDGELIVSVPNIAVWLYRLSLLCGRFDYTKKGTLDETHVRFFTVKTIKQLLTNEGFNIIETKFTGLPFELVLPKFMPASLVRMIDTVYFGFVKLWPTLFSYQIILKARVK